jgi:hypothetical protein
VYASCRNFGCVGHGSCRLLVVGAIKDTQLGSGIRDQERYFAVYYSNGSFDGADWHPVLLMILYNCKDKFILLGAPTNMDKFRCLWMCAEGMVF